MQTVASSRVSPGQVPYGEPDQFGIQTYVYPDTLAKIEASARAMSALDMLNGLKRFPSHILWLNANRREAAYHNGVIGVSVGFNDAVLVRSDPAIYVVEERDGEILSSVRTFP